MVKLEIRIKEINSLDYKEITVRKWKRKNKEGSWRKFKKFIIIYFIKVIAKPKSKI